MQICDTVCMSLVPKISTGGIKNAVMSEPVLAVGAALLFGTAAAGFITNFILKIPFLNQHVTIALVGLSIVILLVAIKMKGGTFRAIAIGLAGGSLFIGLLQVDFVRETISSVMAVIPK